MSKSYKYNTYFRSIIICTISQYDVKWKLTVSQDVEDTAVLTFVSDSLLGKWWLLPQQQTEKQADRQAHRGNPGIRAYNRRAPSAQSFYLLEGGATRVGRPERVGGMVTRVGVTLLPPTTSRKKKKKQDVCPNFIVANTSPGLAHREEDGDDEKCFHHWM